MGLDPPIAFAHHGAPAHERPSSAAGFELALRLGASGLAASVWETRDGVPVAAATAAIRRGLRRRALANSTFAELDTEVLSLDALCDIARGAHLSLDVMDVNAFEACADRARASGSGADASVWICHRDWDTLLRWRSSEPDVALVHVAELETLPHGPERHGADLAAAGIDAMALPYRNWSRGLVTLFHRFERLAFGRDAIHERMLDDLLAMGVDAVYSAHPDRMTDAFQRAGKA